jgi:hypothetical protein
MQRGRETSFEGSHRSVYLFYEPPFSVFPYGASLLAATSRLGDRVRVETHRDREGTAVFRSLRFAGDHTLVYRGGRFEVRTE